MSSPQNPKPSLICGTIHLGTDECLFHWPVFRAGIEKYDVIYTESSLDESDIQYLQHFTLLDDAVTIEDFVSERRWAKMRQVFIKYCQFDIELFKKLRPLFIIAQIQSRLVDADRLPALDQMIWNEALKQGKEVRGIESSIEQIEILKNLDIATQYQQIVKMSKNISTTRKKLRKLLLAYKDEKITHLYQMSKGTLGPDKHELLRNRNQIIAQRILEKHNSQESLFSFGAGHLAGGEGVLRILKKSGASLKALNNEIKISTV